MIEEPKKQDYHKTVKVDFLGHNLVVALTDDVIKYREETLQKKYPAFNKTSGSASAFCCYCEAYPNKTFIVLEHDASIGIIAHEIVHACDNIMDIYGLEGTEIRAYLLSYFLDELVDWIYV